MDALRYVKLRSGDELFGSPEKSPEPDMLRLGSPCRLLLTPKGHLPMPMPLNYVEVAYSEIVLSGEVDADLTAAYTAQQSGLSLPPQGLLVPGVSE